MAALAAEVGRPGDRVLPRGQLPQPVDLPRPAGRAAVRRRHPDHPAARRPRSARRRLPAARARVRSCSATDAARAPRSCRDHPVNQARLAPGKPPANAIWLWGQGKAPQLPQFADLHGLKGAILSAVDLVRGVGMLAGWDRIDVPGATGYLDTDYAAKGRYARRGARGSRHRLRPRRGPRRGEPRGPRRGQGRGPRADRPRHRRAAPARRSSGYELADPGLARPRDLAPDPGPRPRLGHLGHGRDGPDRLGLSLR